MIRRSTALISCMLLVFITQSSLQTSHANDLNIKILTPTNGSKVSLLGPITFALQFSGKAAEKHTSCIDNNYLFKFLMINKDGSSRQRYWYPEYTGGEEARLYRWKFLPTPEGYSCTFIFGYISKEQSAQVQRIDLTWREGRDKELFHNYFDVDNSYSPSFRIIGVERAEVINYVKEFEVELRVPKTGGNVSIDAFLRDKDLRIICQNPIDSQRASTATETVFISSCLFEVTPNVIGSQILTARASYKGDVGEPFQNGESPFNATIPIIVGKSGTLKVAHTLITFTGLNPTKPWEGPGLLKLEGSVCIVDDMDKKCGVGVNMSRAKVEICINEKSCKPVVVSQQGLLSFEDKYSEDAVTPFLRAQFYSMRASDYSLPTSRMPFAPQPTASPKSNPTSVPIKEKRPDVTLSLSGPSRISVGGNFPLIIRLSGKVNSVRSCRIDLWENKDPTYRRGLFEPSLSQKTVKVKTNQATKVIIPIDIFTLNSQYFSVSCEGAKSRKDHRFVVKR
jgi:hypothetical protein